MWSTTSFVELTERRNIFVHSDGIVSSQYLSVCRKHKVILPDNCTLNSNLDVTPEYFNQAYECLYEISAKLAQVIWRKLIPSEMDDADIYLNSICYELLKKEKYRLAKRLLEFARSLPKHSNQRNKLIFIINSCIAYKWGGEPEKATKLLSETDWSASNDDFQLAVAALLEEFDRAKDIMRKIGNHGSIGKAEYKDWPVFRDFRKSPQFLETYNELFGEKLEIIEIHGDNTVEIIDADDLTTQRQSDKEGEIEELPSL